MLAELIQNLEQNPSDTLEIEERAIANPITWKQYETLLLKLEDNSSYRVTYLNGVLEIVSPSRRHEGVKKRIATLLEVYFEETDTEYFPLGSTTFRTQKRRGGTEPDESYCIGTEKAFPDLAIEVVFTSGEIDKLAVYKSLGVLEVWFWQNNQFSLYRLEGDAYTPISKSELLPDLDLTLLTECVRHPNPLFAVKLFRKHFREEFK
ncbi:Uma2 family endonuclease [Lusitaniella coriacea LEGE 07157]|uniref:Uma2 family endonuclease n=1 Tax=Lusitaniella coriacea LEGE 07157 TaxID=945747 RepID=A0A8J7B342_9CYAN|nr:Uma2 family endonuclease [Lusitaniella coriacea]MBE9114782.1 Uma2 family endonuclease [Lusitaniella coriacea LEGE 07157]